MKFPPKCIFSGLPALGVTCFFNIVAPEGGHKIFDHQIGGSLLEIHDPPHSKENGGPLMYIYELHMIVLYCSDN